MPNKPKFEIYKASDGWRWRLKAANGEIVAMGESYENKTDCFNLCMKLGGLATEAVANISEVEK